MQQAPLSPGVGSLGRLDSLDEYFMLNSPPESPQQPIRRSGPNHEAQQTQTPYDMSVYYPGSGSNVIASQGNVKQSTSTFSVDRSNALERNDSLGFGRLMPSTQRDIDEMLKMDDKDISDLNLTELFLKSNHRNSLNENYQAKGALKGHDKDLHRARSNSLSSPFLEDNDRNIDKDANTSSEARSKSTKLQTGTNNNRSKDNSNENNNEVSFDLDFDVDPTPLSEIRAKSEQRKRLREEATTQKRQNQQQQQQSSSGGGLTLRRLDQHQYEQHRQKRRQHSSSYYPFGRSYQLPIPTMPPISPEQKTDTVAQAPLADAVATAAALASVQDSKQGNTAPPPTTSNAPNKTYQHQPGDTPLHAPPLQPVSQPGSAHPGSPHQQSHSPTAAPPHQYPCLHHAHSHQHAHPQHHPHHPSYQPHHLATPLAVGTMPPGMHAPPPIIVGPYTTAQQGNSNTNRRRTSLSATTSFTSSKSSSDSTTAAAPAPPVSYLPRRGHHMPREASAAHTKPKGALAEAAKQRRGYSGFHKPATSQTTNTYHHPLPQKFPNYAAPATAASGARGATQYVKRPLPESPLSKKPVPPLAKPTQPAPPPKSYTNGAHHIQHRAPAPAVVNHPPGDTAYERKKQRAKDARVKLNESIERLHVAMGVAGSESKRRTEQLRKFMKNAGREHENNTDHQAFELMDSCVKTAESAKKWDRPNFVGSAATMIGCLNSQCEILMKELMEQQQAKSPFDRPGRPSPIYQEEGSSEMQGTEPRGSDLQEASSLLKEESQRAEQHNNESQQQEPNGKRSQDHQNSQDAPDDDGTEKRRRLNGNDCEDEKKEACALTDNAETPVSPVNLARTSMTICVPPGSPPVQLEDFVMDLIASFLDPMSLVQCSKVCKDWSGKNHCFQKIETWTKLCLQRFGQLKTRQWQEKHDGEGGGDDRLTKVEGKVLYRTMNAAGVMPSFHFGGRSHILVGRGRLPSGGAAAWLFLVERSNGETMRSVKRNPAVEMKNAGVYASLPVVEVRIVIQNTGTRTGGGKDTTIALNEQRLTVDASTRRRGEELAEIDWDDRFVKRLLNLDGSEYKAGVARSDELARLKLFEAVVLVAFIHARRCSTTAKLIQRGNFMKVLLSSKGITKALILPISSTDQAMF